MTAVGRPVRERTMIPPPFPPRRIIPMGIRPLLLSAALLAFAHPDSFTQGVYILSPVATGLANPARMAFAPDGSGRLFYLELKTGNVRVIRNDTLEAEPWAMFNVSEPGERGLLGIAFDPGFAANGRAYVYYTAAESTLVNRVVRLTEAGGRADTASAVTLFEAPVQTPCGLFTNHNAGALAMVTAGELYISTGENRCPQLSQSLSDPRGKVLRIDPELPFPANAVESNAFRDDGDPLTGNDDRIFASGLRNPYGMTVSPIDSAVYVTENGPDCNDEINRVSNGRNYGWRPECDSGPTHCECGQDSPYTRPLWKVSPTIAPTGLVVYDGTVYPELYGKLLFLSYNDARILVGTFINGGDSLEVSVMDQPGLGALFDIVRGPDGYLYVSASTAIYRINPLPTGVPGGTNERAVSPGIFASRDGDERAMFEYLLDAGSVISLGVHVILGRLVAEPDAGFRSAGVHRVSIDTRGLASGVYFVRLATQSSVHQQKLIITR